MSFSSACLSAFPRELPTYCLFPPPSPSCFHLQRVIWDQHEQEFSYQVNEYLYHRGGSRTTPGAGENNHTEQTEERSVITASLRLPHCSLCTPKYPADGAGSVAFSGLALTSDLWWALRRNEKTWWSNSRGRDTHFKCSVFAFCEYLR